MFSSFALFLCFACSGTEEKSEHISQKTPISGKKDKAKEPSISQELPTELVTAITDWDDLKTLQEELSLAKLLPFFEQFEPDDHLSNATLFEKHQGYRLLVQHLSERVEILTRDMDRDLIVEKQEALRYPAGNVGRKLDMRWFRAQDGFFQLVGIVNRLDKLDFYAGKDCGEIRFIYRLTYQTEEGTSSRLPFTFNLVFRPKEQRDCGREISKWRQNGEELLVQKLKEQGALQLDNYQFKQLELNGQIVRFPAGLETEFAGQAIYLLRVYTWEEADDSLRLIEVPLENTPDVYRLRNDSALQKELTQYIQTHREDIDRGVFLLPEKFLTKEAFSYSTLGLNRLANKPFSALFPDSKSREELWDADSEYLWLNSGEALVEQLNQATCLGCHQAKSTAGFHFLGEDDPDISGVTNRLQLPFSHHFHQEQERREEQLLQFLSNPEQPSFRPPPLKPASSLVSRNQVCLPDEYLDDVQKEQAWRCSAGETCQIVVKQEGVGIQFGQCIPEEKDIDSGNTCREGTIKGHQKKQGRPFNLHNYADNFVGKQIYALSEGKDFSAEEYNCRPTRIGVPLGRTYRKCTSAERKFEGFSFERPPREICAVVGGSRFDSCVEKDFHQCIDSIVARGMVDSCSRDSFCREDYICQALPYQLNGIDTAKGKEIHDAGIGFCTPTYFVFQLRLDGHPVPKISKKEEVPH